MFGLDDVEDNEEGQSSIEDRVFRMIDFKDVDALKRDEKSPELLNDAYHENENQLARFKYVQIKR